MADPDDKDLRESDSISSHLLAQTREFLKRKIPGDPRLRRPVDDQPLAPLPEDDYVEPAAPSPPPITEAPAAPPSPPPASPTPPPVAEDAPLVTLIPDEPKPRAAPAARRAPAPAAPAASNQGLHNYVQQLETMVELNRTDMETLKRDVSGIRVQINELLALYEVASQQMNPFQAAPVPRAPAPPPRMAPPPPVSAHPTAAWSAYYQPPVVEVPEEPVETSMLPRLPQAPLTAVAVLRWLEFLLQRVRRESLPRLFDYYVQINWIGPEAKGELLDYIRGEIPDLTIFEPEDDYFDEDADELSPNGPLSAKGVEEWRLTPEDHLKSYLFILRILGHPVDRNELNEMELDIRSIKGNLKEYYGL